MSLENETWLISSFCVIKLLQVFVQRNFSQEILLESKKENFQSSLKSETWLRSWFCVIKLFQAFVQRNF